MTEDEILTLVAVEEALSRLTPEFSEMMRLIYKIGEPEDWDAPWPPTFEHIGAYIGLKFRGKALSEAAIRYRRDLVLAQWRSERGDLRR